MNDYLWTAEFERLFNKSTELYRQGRRGSENYFNAVDLKFLAAIGCTPQELYDFAEDFINYGEPDYGTALLIAAVRRDYFTHKLKGVQAGQVVATSALPPKSDAVDGIEWLPRIIQKARLKLEGRMDKDLMYGCGGDRRFLKECNLHPADFLRFVWSAEGDDKKIIEFVKKSRKGC